MENWLWQSQGISSRNELFEGFARENGEIWSFQLGLTVSFHKGLLVGLAVSLRASLSVRIIRIRRAVLVLEPGGGTQIQRRALDLHGRNSSFTVKKCGTQVTDTGDHLTVFFENIFLVGEEEGDGIVEKSERKTKKSHPEICHWFEGAAGVSQN